MDKLNIMKKHYEGIFIISPLVTENQLKETVAHFKKLLTSNGGEIIHEEDWGLKKFAYPIKKKSSGYYHLFEFKIEPDFIQKLETEYLRNEKILRFLTVSLDKYALEFNEKRRNGAFNKSASKKKDLLNA
ncbi:MAG: 30S ribosomal protein S6 [Bacteroidota bacterium]|nr:30S ribosomal protein S6 [Bacteroidota bacterium]